MSPCLFVDLSPGHLNLYCDWSLEWWCGRRQRCEDLKNRSLHQAFAADVCRLWCAWDYIYIIYVYIYIYLHTQKYNIYIYISSSSEKREWHPEDSTWRTCFFYVTYREKVTSMYLIDSWLIYFALGPKKSVHVQPVGLPGPWEVFDGCLPSTLQHFHGSYHSNFDFNVQRWCWRLHRPSW